MGYFVPPSIYCKFVLPTLEETITAGHLRVFAGILRGSEATSVLPKISEIGNFLRQSHVCRSRKPRYQEQLLRCCESLIVVCKKASNGHCLGYCFIFFFLINFFQDCSAISQDLFTVLFTLLSMCQDDDSLSIAENLLGELARLDDQSGLEELFTTRLRSILLDLKNSSDTWTIYSAELQIFRVCLTRAAPATAKNADLVLPILKNTMGNDSDPELRLKLFILLGDYFSRGDESISNVEEPRQFATTILQEIIFPGLVWSAGRAAEAIRTAAVCCLCALLDQGNPSEDNDGNWSSANEPKEETGREETSVDKADRLEDSTLEKIVDFSGAQKIGGHKIELFPSREHFSALFQKIVPVLVTLVDDNARKTRLYALRAICLCVETGRKLSFVTEENVHSTYPVILKRLDDGCDDVRSAAVEALVVVWRALPERYDLVFSRSHVDFLYTTAIIHLDDHETKFQTQMLGKELLRNTFILLFLS